MRFTSDGPSLPDELLAARDADQVLFFCGAGVSQAEAHLPNFAVLAENVLALLGSALDSPARRLFDAAREFEKKSGLTGLVATDRIFGMLEREFEPSEVREAVALALKPGQVVNLNAHRTLLDLSRTRAGVPRLVTTNFDLLFEACEPGIASSNPPRLPDPHRDADFRGIVHLHGRVDAEYQRASDDEFVLSSADFGHAYLSDGWATRYIQRLLQRFRIVFVGYSADDPPVQYLLEALKRFAKPDHALYAFQSGDATQALAQWAHKGVEPIAYDNTNGHATLWTTLSAWAQRARDVDGWHDQLIANAGRGPAMMAPHERGMIKHLAATTTGARLLATTDNPLPADWLCVIDRNLRYARAGKVNISDEMNSRFDPFDAFGLDSDVPPMPLDLNDNFAKREVPGDAWDGLTSTPADRVNLLLEASAQLRGGAADVAPSLSSRLWHLGVWIVRIAHQPATLWWAAQQAKLHPDIQQRIQWALRHEAARFTPVVRDGWRMLLACWQQSVVDPSFRRYDIDAKAKVEGWSPSLVRETVSLYRPILTVSHPARIKAPESSPTLTLNDIVRFDVDYPRPHESLSIPSEMLGYAVELFRQQLEYAIQLEREVNGRDDLYFDTTRPDDGETLGEDGYNLTGHLVTFTNMMAGLAAVDRDAARREVARWSGMNDQLFKRLRIWAGGRAELTTPEEAGQIFLDLDDETFWMSKQERDLLFSLRDRWSELPPLMIDKIETRLCQGHFPWGEQREDRDELIAHYRLNRLHWLSTRGVTFSFNYQVEVAALRARAPNWTERSSEHTAQPQVSRVYSIQTDTNATPLERLPISEVLEAASSLGQHDFDSHVQRQPFRGLAKERPARALSVLTDASRRGVFASWAWSALLSSEGSAALSIRILSAIGYRLARLTPAQLKEIAHSVSEWLNDRGERLLRECPEVFDLVWNAMIRALAAAPDVKRFPRPDRGWVDEGLNRPAGRMVSALFKDPASKTFEPAMSLPDVWKDRLDQLLGLPGDHRPHAIAMITPQLNWLFQTDPDWIEDKLLPLAGGGSDDSQAFWAGYFWGARTPQLSLYHRLKPAFIALARQKGLRREHANQLAGMLLAGWGSDDGNPGSVQLVSDVELREILIHAEDDLRTQMLWHLERWVLEPDGDWGNRLVPFLARAWPRQRDVRTMRVSGRLADLALAIPDRFPEIVKAILPRLVPVKGHLLRPTPFLDGEASIVRRYPQALVDLLCAILSEDPVDWPYEIGKVLDQLAEQPETRGDLRLAELRRRDQRR